MNSEKFETFLSSQNAKCILVDQLFDVKRNVSISRKIVTRI